MKFYVKRKGNKKGLVDEKGNVIAPIAYDKIDNQSSVKVIIVTKDKLKGAISKITGKFVLKPIYDQVTIPYYGSKFLEIDKNDMMGAASIDTGKIVVPPIYDFVEYHKSGFFRVSTHSNGKNGIINSKGKIVIPAIYDDVYFRKGGFFEVLLGDKFGLIREDGYMLIPPAFKEVDYASGSAAFTHGSHEFFISRALGTLTRHGVIDAIFNPDK
jgi:hypothetical protein